MKFEQPTSVVSGAGPLIVVGMWRSGTSLLYSLLNQHPDIALMYEADLFLLEPLFTNKGSNPDWRSRWEFWNSALSRHHIRAERIPVAVPDLRSGAMAAWEEYADGAAVMGEKSPNYFDCLPILAQKYPGARFLIIWRDLADTCRSIVRARSGSTFFSKPGLLHRAVIGYHKLKQGRDALLSKNVPVHEIQYEEMIHDPAVVFAGVCRFLGVPFDARMTTLEGVDSSPIYEGSHHNQVKSGKIESTKERREVLLPQVRRKIQRYVNYWRKESGGGWPRYPESQQNTSDVPGPSERFFDEVLFRGLRALDQFTALVYCYAPFSWLDSYRSFKNRRFANSIDAPQALQTHSVQPHTVHIQQVVAAGEVAEEARQHVGS
jgi:Sulfotransferase family